MIWSWYTVRWRVGCYIWYNEEGTGWDSSPPRPILAVPNVTAHPSTDSVPITVSLLCGAQKGICILLNLHAHEMYDVQCVSKKYTLWCLIITLANLDRFSKFFHQLIRRKILYVRKISTSSAVCRYTTLWNSKSKNVTEFAPLT